MRLPVLLMPDATDVWTRCSRPGAGKSLSLWEGTERQGAWTQLGTVLLRKQRKLRPVLEQAG